MQSFVQGLTGWGQRPAGVHLTVAVSAAIPVTIAFWTETSAVADKHPKRRIARMINCDIDKLIIIEMK